MSSDVFYVRSGEGGFLMEVPRPDGSCDYVKAEPGLSFMELPNGKFMAVRDTAEAARQREMSSHERYFESIKNDQPADVRQRLRRQDALQRKLQVLSVERVDAPKIPEVRTIKDEQFADYMLAYAAETQRRGGKPPPAHEWDFQPLVAYQEKLTKHKIRPIYKGEVGVYGSDILVLEQGYGTGNQVQVTEQLSKA